MRNRLKENECNKQYTNRVEPKLLSPPSKGVPLSDLLYIAKTVNLSLEKTKALVEEPRDFNLVIDSICEKKMSEEDALALSFKLFVKICLFKFCKNVNFSLEEKSYVAECIANHFPNSSKGQLDKININKPSESQSQFYLVICGLFKESITANKKFPFSFKQCMNFVSDGFRKAEHRDLANHVYEWVEIMQKMKESSWN
jgi:hypothetical protein